MKKLFYKIYHANLAFSAIPEEELSKVIEKTYFPLLEFIESTNTKTALEISGYSLEIILSLHPEWIQKFKELHQKNLIELIGSGYMQIIAPLVPYEVNIKNQHLGLEVYQEILGITPDIVFVNEQTFSKSLVDIYHEVGYKAIVMEWNNPYSLHSTLWNKQYSHTPVLVSGLDASLPVIWSDSVLFQQFQRFAHDETSLNDYEYFFSNYIPNERLCVPIYSSDLEIFNYRPGRFETEATITNDEWLNIKKIVTFLKSYGDFVLPFELLAYTNPKIQLDFTHATTPIVLKKQTKYSLSRWAACGRGANLINTLCYNYFINMQDDLNVKKLLQYWGSDFRTHITVKKWDKAIDFLENQRYNPHNILKNHTITNDKVLKEVNNKIIFEKENYKIVFNKAKGLSLDSITTKGQLLPFGTIKHGDLDYITHGADFYTSTSTIESAHTRKVSDLSTIDTYNFDQQDENIYRLSSSLKMKDLATESKVWTIDLNTNELALEIFLELNHFINGSIRLGTFTLLPQNKKDIFWYECKNGGKEYERFYITDTTRVDHSHAKSILQSSSGGIGVTNGVLRFGIDTKVICEIIIDRAVSYPFVMLQNSVDHAKHLTRVFFGLQELDDTLKHNENREFKLKYKIRI